MNITEYETSLGQLLNVLYEDIKNAAIRNPSFPLEKIAKVVRQIDDGGYRVLKSNILRPILAGFESQYSEKIFLSFDRITNFINESSKDNHDINKKCCVDCGDKIEAILQRENVLLAQTYWQKYFSLNQNIADVKRNIHGETLHNIKQRIDDIYKQKEQFLNEIKAEAQCDHIIKKAMLLSHNLDQTYENLTKVINLDMKALYYKYTSFCIYRNENIQQNLTILGRIGEELLSSGISTMIISDENIYEYISYCKLCEVNPNQKVITLFQERLQNVYLNKGIHLSEVQVNQILDIKQMCFLLQHYNQRYLEGKEGATIVNKILSEFRNINNLFNEVDDNVKNVVNGDMMIANITFFRLKFYEFFQAQNNGIYSTTSISKKYDDMYKQCEDTVSYYITKFDSSYDFRIDTAGFRVVCNLIGDIYKYNCNENNYHEAYKNLMLLERLIMRNNIRFPREANKIILQNEGFFGDKFLQEKFSKLLDTKDMSFIGVLDAIDAKKRLVRPNDLTEIHNNDAESLQKQLEQQEKDADAYEEKVKNDNYNKYVKRQRLRLAYMDNIILKRQEMRKKEEYDDMSKRIEGVRQIFYMGDIKKFRSMMANIEEDLASENRIDFEKLKRLATLINDEGIVSWNQISDEDERRILQNASYNYAGGIFREEGYSSDPKGCGSKAEDVLLDIIKWNENDYYILAKSNKLLSDLYYLRMANGISSKGVYNNEEKLKQKRKYSKKASEYNNIALDNYELYFKNTHQRSFEKDLEMKELKYNCDLHTNDIKEIIEHAAKMIERDLEKICIERAKAMFEHRHTWYAPDRIGVSRFTEERQTKRANLNCCIQSLRVWEGDRRRIADEYQSKIQALGDVQELEEPKFPTITDKEAKRMNGAVSWADFVDHEEQDPNVSWAVGSEASATLGAQRS